MAGAAVMVRLWTARIDYPGRDRFDVSRKSGALVFAPSWALLGPYLRKRKEGGLTDADWAAYVEAYTAEMRASYTEHRATWKRLLAYQEATLLCYCTDPARCHRTVLAGILGKLGADVRGELS